MNEYNVKVNFEKGQILTNLKKLVQNDYNSTKLNFTFDKEGRVLFKLLYPDGTQYVDEIQNNELVFGPGILNQEGDYEYEIVLYTDDGRLTDHATKSFEVRSELVNTDELVAPDDRVPVLDSLINEVTAIKTSAENGEFDGEDGVTPTIGENGNWFIGEEDTGLPSQGPEGKPGPAGGILLEEVTAITGELENLSTEDKGSLVNAINEVGTEIANTKNQITENKRINGWIDTYSGVYIDTTAKTLTFGASSFISFGSQLVNVANTTHDVSAFLGGQFVYYNTDNKTLTATRNNNYPYLGAMWSGGFYSDFHMDKRKLYVDGMPVNYGGKYFKKTVNVLGDSMTQGVGTTKAYHQWLGQLCGFKIINVYGVGGSCITPIGNHEPAWTGEEDIKSFYERYSSMSTTADAITVFGCVNDWSCGRELGSIADTTTDTFYGTMKLLCEGLINKYPTNDIYFISSPQCDYINRPANKLAGSPWAGNTEGYNRKGYKLQDYARAMGEVCAIYGIPFLNLTDNCFWGLSGVLSNGKYGTDNLHPNAEGHKRIAQKIANFVNNGYGNSPVANEPKYELIEDITLTEDAGAIDIDGLSLNKFVAYLDCPIGTQTVDCGIKIFSGSDTVGYAWISGVVSATVKRKCSFEGRNEGGLMVFENTNAKDISGSVGDVSNSYLYRKVWEYPLNKPITKIRVWGGSGKGLPTGTTLRIWGVKA